MSCWALISEATPLRASPDARGYPSRGSVKRWGPCGDHVSSVAAHSSAPLAQSAERLHGKEKVHSSIL